MSNHPTEGPPSRYSAGPARRKRQLAITPEDPALNIVAEIGVADIDPATPEAGPHIMLARANDHALLHIRVDSDGHIVTDRL